MKISKILEKIKKKLVEISTDPGKCSIDFGNFALSCSSFEMTSLPFHLYDGYVCMESRYGECQMQHSFYVTCYADNEDMSQIKKYLQETTYLRNLIIRPSNITLVSAFISEYKETFINGSKSKVSMKIECDYFINGDK